MNAMRMLPPALAALVLAGSAYSQNLDDGAVAPPAQATTPAKMAAPEVKKGPKSAADRPGAPAAPVAQNSLAAAPDDLGEQPINAAPLNPAVQSQDSDADDRSDEGYRGPIVAVPLLIAGIGFLALSGLALYFLPTIIAVARRKRNGWAIFAINFFFGWSFIGWVAALVWSVMSDPP